MIRMRSKWVVVVSALSLVACAAEVPPSKAYDVEPPNSGATKKERGAATASDERSSSEDETKTEMSEADSSGDDPAPPPAKNTTDPCGIIGKTSFNLFLAKNHYCRGKGLPTAVVTVTGETVQASGTQFAVRIPEDDATPFIGTFDEGLCRAKVTIVGVVDGGELLAELTLDFTKGTGYADIFQRWSDSDTCRSTYDVGGL